MYDLLVDYLQIRNKQYNENPTVPTLAMGKENMHYHVWKRQLDPMLRGIKNSRKTMSWPVLLFIGGSDAACEASRESKETPPILPRE